jgi:hypothetical protein
MLLGLITPNGKNCTLRRLGATALGKGSLASRSTSLDLELVRSELDPAGLPHLLLQPRTKALNNELEEVVRR